MTLSDPTNAVPTTLRDENHRRSAYRKCIGDWALPSLWLIKYRNLKGQPMRFYSQKDPFYHRPWQVAPVDDMSQKVVVKKGRQMGFTEIFLSNVVYLSSLVRCRTIYTMPKWDKAQEIARTRIDPLGLDGHPDAFHGEVLDRLVGWRSVMHKDIRPRSGGGLSEVLITGSWNEDLGESTAADRVLLDEYDRMKPGVISAFMECLSSSKMHHLRIFSTPTFPKVGVDGQYMNSDQNRWMYKCPRCGHWSALGRANLIQIRGPDSLVQRLESHDETAKVPDGTFQIQCLRCGRELDRWHAKCQWVPGKPDGEYRGYWASQLDCVWISADDVMRKLREYKPLGKWYNYVVAEGYLGDAGQLPENFVYKLVDPTMTILSRDDFNQQFKTTYVSVGVDWGKANWVFVLGYTPNHPNPILLENKMILDTNDPEDTVVAVNEIAKKWRAEVMVADYGYGHDRNPKLYKMAPCQFWVCKYPPAGSAGATSDPLFGHSVPGAARPYPEMAIGRAPSLKERIIELVNERLTIPRISDMENSLDIIDMHFRNIAIVVEEARDGSSVEVAETTGPDHYLHAFNYAMIGLHWLKMYSITVRELDPPNSIVSGTGRGVDVGLPTFDDIVDTLEII